RALAPGTGLAAHADHDPQRHRRPLRGGRDHLGLPRPRRGAVPSAGRRPYAVRPRERLRLATVPDQSRPSTTTAAVNALAELPGISEKVEAARQACTQLRWHNGLRRRIPEAAAESRVRGAWASGELEGARLSTDIVRDL